MACEPPHRMVHRLLHATGGKSHEGEVTFDDPGNGRTRVVWRCRFEAAVL